MFPSGDPEWTVNIKNVLGDRNVTPLQFYMYRLLYRGDFNPCLSLGKLTQQYVVDVWSKVEGTSTKGSIILTKLTDVLYFKLKIGC